MATLAGRYTTKAAVAHNKPVAAMRGSSATRAAAAAAPHSRCHASAASASGPLLSGGCRAHRRAAGTALAGRSRRAVAPRADVNADAFGAPALRGAAALRAAARAPAPEAPSVRQFDFLVVGSGIAGLSYALKVAPYGKVAVVTKDAAAEGCTRYAQGGVCAVLDPLDSVEKHARDTIVAGAFLNDPK